eukprot:9300728-Pyramimonas_sp.AAC.1
MWTQTSASPVNETWDLGPGSGSKSQAAPSRRRQLLLRLLRSPAAWASKGSRGGGLSSGGASRSSPPPSVLNLPAMNQPCAQEGPA